MHSRYIERQYKTDAKKYLQIHRGFRGDIEAVLQKLSSSPLHKKAMLLDDRAEHAEELIGSHLFGFSN